MKMESLKLNVEKKKLGLYIPSNYFYGGSNLYMWRERQQSPVPDPELQQHTGASDVKQGVS